MFILFSRIRCFVWSIIKNGKDNSNSYFWKQKKASHLKHRKKWSERCYVFIFKKKTYKRRKRHCSKWTLQIILENQAFQRTAKFIEVKDIIFVSRWGVQYLEKPASQWLLVETWRWNWIIKVFAGALLCLEWT